MTEAEMLNRLLALFYRPTSSSGSLFFSYMEDTAVGDQDPELETHLIAWLDANAQKGNDR